MQWISLLLLGVAAVGLITFTGFLCLLLVALQRFRSRPQAVAGTAYPGVSLLKPLCGLEPNLRENLESFFRQDYPEFEIVFAARYFDDPALQLVAELRREYPTVQVRVITSGTPNRANAKVCSLTTMFRVARYDYFIISDSDVEVRPDYIARVVQPLLDPNVGIVTCLYRGVPSGGFWSKLEALGMSVEMTAGVLVADLLEGMKFALGPTMAIRRDVVEDIGGFRPLADFCADDYVLGQRVYQSGKQVILSSNVIDHIVVNRSFRASAKHQLRWMKSTRFSRPAGHVASVLSFAMPFGVLGLLGAISLGHPWLGVAMLGAAFLNRVFLSLAAGWGAVRDWRALAYCWLYPLRDLTGFLVWAASFFGREIEWRGERYLMQPGGFMLPAPNLTFASLTPIVAEETVSASHV